MRLLGNKIFLIIISLVIIFLVITFTFFLLRPEQPTSPGTVPETEQLTEYPDNLLEGRIISVGLEEPVGLAIEADISKIISGAGKMEKKIKINNDTELILHNLTNQQESPLKLDELKPGDGVVVATQESTYEEVKSRETFTATKITKMITSQQLLPNEKQQ